jgi:copper(I)-binding protein
VKKGIPSIAILAVLLGGLPAEAAQVTVSDAWFRALPSNLPAGGYFTLHNAGNDVKLTGAQSPACGMLMLHRSTTNGGMAEMTMVDSVDVPRGGSLSFSPGDYHLMCTAPTSAMTPGAHVPVTLKFSDGTAVTATFDVRNASGK